MRFKIINECVERDSGQRLHPGDWLADPSDAEEKRLRAAGCLADGPGEAAPVAEDEGDLDPAAIAREQINEDKLFDRSIDELKGIAAAEGVIVPEDAGDSDKEKIVAAIRQARSDALIAAAKTRKRGKR